MRAHEPGRLGPQTRRSAIGAHGENRVNRQSGRPIANFTADGDGQASMGETIPDIPQLPQSRPISWSARGVATLGSVPTHARSDRRRRNSAPRWTEFRRFAALSRGCLETCKDADEARICSVRDKPGAVGWMEYPRPDCPRTGNGPIREGCGECRSIFRCPACGGKHQPALEPEIAKNGGDEQSSITSKSGIDKSAEWGPILVEPRVELFSCQLVSDSSIDRLPPSVSKNDSFPRSWNESGRHLLFERAGTPALRAADWFA